MASLLSLDGAGPIKMHTLLNLYIAITIGCIVKWTKMEGASVPLLDAANSLVASRAHKKA